MELVTNILNRITDNISRTDDYSEHFTFSCTCVNSSTKVEQFHKSNTLLYETFSQQTKKYFKVKSKISQDEWHLSPNENVYQLKVLRQRNAAACGYHAIFTALCCIKACSAENQDETIQHLYHLRDRASFWIVYNRMKNIFLQKAKQEENKFPWEAETIEYGVLEREFIQYLLEKETLHFNVDGCVPMTALSDISPLSLKLGVNGVQGILKIHDVFDRFYRTTTNVVHSFLVGSDNHWFSVLVNKHFVNGEAHLECIYLDARNNRLLSRDKQELLEEVKRRYRDHKAPFFPEDFVDDEWNGGMEGYMPLYYNSLLDSVHTLRLIFDCVRGKQDFRTVALERVMLDILDRFDTLVVDDNGLMLWLEEFHPSYLTEMFISRVNGVGLEYVQKTTKSRILSFCNSFEDFNKCESASVLNALQDAVQAIKRLYL